METSLSTWVTQAKGAVVGFLSGLPTYASDILIFAPVGIFVGFLSKTMGRYFVVGLILAIGIFWLADYFHVITFHHTQLQALIGGGQFNSLHDAGTFAMSIMREHIAAVFAALIGFIVGWKIGS